MNRNQNPNYRIFLTGSRCDPYKAISQAVGKATASFRLPYFEYSFSKRTRNTNSSFHLHSFIAMTWTELHEACEKQQSTECILQLVHEHPEHVLQVDDHGSTPLHLLCWGNPDGSAVQALVDACPQVASDQDAHGDTPLHVACSYRTTNKHLIKALLDASPDSGSIANHEGLMPLHVACRHASDNEGMIGLLLDAYPYALLSHIKMGSPAPMTVRRKRAPPLHAVVDPTGGMATKDSAALRYEVLDVQQRDGSYPLHLAVQSKASVSVLEMLIKEEPGVLLKTNKYGESSLHIALKHGADNEETVRLLVQCASGAVRIRDVKGNLPIHIAAIAGCSDHVVKDLLNVWSEAIHEVNAEGSTPLELAVQNGHCRDAVLSILSISDQS